MIRKASRADILPFVRLGEKFWYESNTHLYFGGYNAAHVQRMLDHGFTNEKLHGWAALEQGEVKSGIVLTSDSCLWNGESLLKEIAWFCAPEDRGSLNTVRLYKEVEKFAVSNNYKYIIMGRIKGVPSFEKLDKFYKKQGFSSLEEEYIKPL